MPSAKCMLNMLIWLLVIYLFQLIPLSWKYIVIFISNKDIHTLASAATRFNIKVSHNRYMNSHHKDQNPFQCKDFLGMKIAIKNMLSALLRLSYLYNRNLFIGKTVSLYWNHLQTASRQSCLYNANISVLKVVLQLEKEAHECLWTLHLCHLCSEATGPVWDGTLLLHLLYIWTKLKNSRVIAKWDILITMTRHCNTKLDYLW